MIKTLNRWEKQILKLLYTKNNASENVEQALITLTLSIDFCESGEKHLLIFISFKRRLF